MLQYLDGHTTGPHTFSVPIGQASQNCKNRPIIEYFRIYAPIPVVDMEMLSTRQKYI